MQSDVTPDGRLQAVTMAEPKKEEEATAVAEKTKEDKQGEIVPKFTAAFNAGLKVLAESFDQIIEETPPGDDEDEDDDDDEQFEPEITLEARDPYAKRKLPFIIGTPAFLQDDLVGLEEEVEEEAEEEVDDEAPDEEGGDDDDEAGDNSDSDSESDSEGDSESDEDSDAVDVPEPTAAGSDEEEVGLFDATSDEDSDAEPRAAAAGGDSDAGFSGSDDDDATSQPGASARLLYLMTGCRGNLGCFTGRTRRGNQAAVSHMAGLFNAIFPCSLAH